MINLVAVLTLDKSFELHLKLHFGIILTLIDDVESLDRLHNLRAQFDSHGCLWLTCTFRKFRAMPFFLWFSLGLIQYFGMKIDTRFGTELW